MFYWRKTECIFQEEKKIEENQGECSSSEYINGKRKQLMTQNDSRCIVLHVSKGNFHNMQKSMFIDEL